MTSGGGLILGLCVSCLVERATVAVDWRNDRRGPFCQNCLSEELKRISAEARLDRAIPSEEPPAALPLGICETCFEFPAVKKAIVDQAELALCPLCLIDS